MRVSTLLVTAAASLLSITPTTARITGFYAPATVVPGATLPILIRAENYIQPVQDVAVAFGITPAEEHYPGTLGTFMGEESIGPANSNIVGNITANISVPTSRPEGSATITAVLFALYGKSLSGSVEYFAVNVTVGDETSAEYVASEYELLQPYQARKWIA